MVGSGAEIAPLRVLWTGANFAQQSTSHQPREPGARGRGPKSDDRGDCAHRSTASVREGLDESLVGVVERGAVDLSGVDCHARSAGDLLESQVGKPGFAPRAGHALDATAPLLDEAQRVKDASDDAGRSLEMPFPLCARNATGVVAQERVKKAEVPGRAHVRSQHLTQREVAERQRIRLGVTELGDGDPFAQFS